MHILAFILMFVLGSIGAALNGDFSGIGMIGKVLAAFGCFTLAMWIMLLFTGGADEIDGYGQLLLISIGMIIVGKIMITIERHC